MTIAIPDTWISIKREHFKDDEEFILLLKQLGFDQYEIDNIDELQCKTDLINTW